MVFVDGDAVLSRRWIEVVAEVFRKRPAVGTVASDLLADRIEDPGTALAEAFARVEAPPPADVDGPRHPCSPYGCGGAVRVEGLFFDEKLVFYGWLDGRDSGGASAHRAAQPGALKGGRVSGARLGYPQIVSPVYPWRKGTTRIGPVVGRAGRLHGDAVGLLDGLRGRLTPEKATQL